MIWKAIVCRVLSRSIAGMPFNLTVNSCGPRRYVAPGGPRFVIRSAGRRRGRGRHNLPLIDLWKYIIKSSLSWREPPAATVQARLARSLRPLGFEYSQCGGQRRHRRAKWRAARGHELSSAGANRVPASDCQATFDFRNCPLQTGRSGMRWRSTM